MIYKNYRIEGLGTFSMYVVRAPGQGTVPDVLSGMYTSSMVAKTAIDNYLNSLKKGKKSDAKTSTKKTSEPRG